MAGWHRKRLIKPDTPQFVTSRTHQARFLFAPHARPKDRLASAGIADTADGSRGDRTDIRHSHAGADKLEGQRISVATGKRGRRKKLSVVKRIKLERAALDEFRSRRQALQELIARIEAGDTNGLYIEAHELPETIENIIGARFALAVERYGVDFFAGLAMSNHPHSVVQAKKENLPRFQQYVGSTVAIAINNFHKRRNGVFGKKYAQQPILDEVSLIGRVLYLILNPPKANLVDKCSEWDGFSSLQYLLTGKDPKYLFFDRTKWHRAKKPKNIVPYLRVVTLKHTPLPVMETLSEEERRAAWAKLIEEGEQSLRQVRQAEGKKVMGAIKLANVDPFDKPESPKQSPEPLCFAADRETYQAYQEEWRAWNELYAIASEQWCQGNFNAEFPQYGIPPPIIVPPYLLAA